MTEHDIVSIVRSAGFRVADQFRNTCDEQAAIRLFGVAAAFGAAMEREACARTVYDATDSIHDEGDMVLKDIIASAIRARGKQ